MTSFCITKTIWTLFLNITSLLTSNPKTIHINSTGYDTPFFSKKLKKKKQKKNNFSGNNANILLWNLEIITGNICCIFLHTFTLPHTVLHKMGFIIQFWKVLFCFNIFPWTSFLIAARYYIYLLYHLFNFSLKSLLRHLGYFQFFIILNVQ